MVRHLGDEVEHGHIGVVQGGLETKEMIDVNDYRVQLDPFHVLSMLEISDIFGNFFFPLHHDFVVAVR